MSPYYECPRFETCSCNNCPLDPDIAKRSVLPSDEKCTARKSVRHRIGLQYADLLPFQGLTSREFKGKQRWASLGEAQKQKVINSGLKGLSTLNLDTKNQGL